MRNPKRWIFDFKTGLHPVWTCILLLICYLLTNSIVCMIPGFSNAVRVLVTDLAAIIWCLPCYLFFVGNRSKNQERYCFSGIGIGFLVLLFLVLYVFSQGFGFVLQEEFPQSYLHTYGSILESDSELVVYMIASVTVAPVFEELLFRGFFYRFLSRVYSRWICLLVSMAFFVLIHMSVPHIPIAAGLTLFLCFLYDLTGSIKWCMLFHMLYNLLGVTVIVSVPAKGIGFVIGFFVVFVGLFICYGYALRLRGRFQKGNGPGLEERICHKRDAFLEQVRNRNGKND